MPELNSKIVAALASRLSEREVARRLRCTIAQVRAALDQHARRILAPHAVLRAMIEGVERLGVIERTSGDARIGERARRQRERHARLILQRTPTRQPM
jgi:hypothetical protein